MKKKTAVWLLILLAAMVGVVLVRSDRIYLSHEALVTDTIADLLAKNESALPNQAVDLSRLHLNPDIPLNKVTSWQTEQVSLKNTTSVFRAIVDDDPTYRLQADLQVTFADGRNATLTWESWRDGVVIGSIVISMGDGPPGYITAISEG